MWEKYAEIQNSDDFLRIYFLYCERVVLLKSVNLLFLLSYPVTSERWLTVSESNERPLSCIGMFDYVQDAHRNCDCVFQNDRTDSWV